MVERRRALGFEGPAAASHGALDGNGDQRRGVFLERIAAENDKIGELAGFDGTFQILFVGSVSTVNRSYANGFFHSDFLFGPPDIAFRVRAGHFGLQRHHGDEFSWWIIGSLRRANAGVEEAAQGKHMIQPLRAVIPHLFAMIVDVGGERRGNSAQRFDAGDQAVVDDGAVFQAEARIAAGAFLLQPLVDAERSVDAHVAVGVRADLPSGEMRFAAIGIKLVLGHHENPVVVGAAFIRDRKARGAFRDRAVADQLHGADTNPLVAEACADPGLDHRIDKPVVDEAVGAKEQIAGIAGVLISAKIRGIALGFSRGGDSGPGEHFGDELHPLAMIVAREIAREGFLKERLSAFGNAAAQFSRDRVVIDLPARRIRGLIVDSRLRNPREFA